MKILVVDDESSIRNLIRMQLEMEGYEVLTAADGREALERWNEQPDVLILDVMLPDTDGMSYYVYSERRSVISRCLC